MAAKKPAKPRLTDAMTEKLAILCGFAEAEADMISDGTADQQQEAKDVRDATDWIRALVRWKRGRKSN